MNNSNILMFLNSVLFFLNFQNYMLFQFNITCVQKHTHTHIAQHTFAKYITHVLFSTPQQNTNWISILIDDIFVLLFFYFLQSFPKKIKLPTILLFLKYLFSKLKLFPFTFAIRNICIWKSASERNLIYLIIFFVAYFFFLHIIAW